MDGRAAAVSGLPAAAKALFVAAAAQDMPHGVVWYVVPSDGDIEQAVQDVAFFLAALEGLPGTIADRAVLPFPSYEVDPYRGLSPHVGVTSARARALHSVGCGAGRVIVASAAALVPRMSAPQRLLGAALELKPGQEVAPSDLAAHLVDAGFTREDPADEHGEFAVRGGIVDIFPAGESQPVRLEFVGDTIESMRRYDPATQRSVQTIDQITIVPLLDALAIPPSRSTRFERWPGPEDQRTPDAGESVDGALFDRSATIADYFSLAGESRIIVSEPDEVGANGLALLDQLQQSYDEAVARNEQALPPSQLFSDWSVLAARLGQGTALQALGVDDDSSEVPRRKTEQTVHVRCQSAVALRGRFVDWVAEIRKRRQEGGTAVFVTATAGRAERTIELLKEYEVFAVPLERADDAQYAAVLVTIGSLSRGFSLAAAGLHLYSEGDVFEEERRAPDRQRAATKAFLSDLRDLKVGDLVVHIDHGIGMFVGLKQIVVATDAVQEFLELRYAGDDKLFVPVERLDLVQKYTGAAKPPLDRLGGTSWERAKTRVKKAMRDMAEELLKLYAARRAISGHAFGSDTHWQEEFEEAFAYELTPDQKSAIADIKSDMESPTPMDRLLCGDVGYGKTEVAMRAAFKAVLDGKQVAFLAPTTVLAFRFASRW